MKKKRNFTEGSILKALLSLSVPIVLANFFQIAYNLTDTFWVGRLGTEAVAAVSVSFPIIFLIISFVAGISMAGTILVAQYKGKKSQEAINHISAQTLMIISGMAIVLSGLGYLVSPILIRLMRVDTAVLAQAISYMRISFIGVVFMFIYAAFQSLMRGVGNVKMPMFIILGTVLLNLGLDPLFIFGFGPVPALGVAGAALASTVTEFLSALIAVIILFAGKEGININFNQFKPDFKLMKKMFLLGWPSSLEQSTRALGFTVVTFLVTGFGTLALASYGIGTRILSFILIPVMGLSMAASTLVGQNIGSGKIKRAERTAKLSLIISFIGLTVAGILLFIFAEPIARLFVPGEIATIQTTATFLRIISFSLGFVGVQQTIKGIFRGAGDTLAAMMLSLIFLWGLRFPLVYFLSHYTSLGLQGVWWAFPISNILAAVIAMFWFSFGTWKKRKLTEKIKLEDAVAEEVDVIGELND